MLYDSLRLWRLLPHRLWKRQSLSATVLFRATLTRTVILNLLIKWLLGSTFQKMLLLSKTIRHLHISHNAPYLPPRILHNLCFSFLLGITAAQREIETMLMQNLEGARIWFFILMFRNPGRPRTSAYFCAKARLMRVTSHQEAVWSTGRFMSFMAALLVFM